MKARLSRVHTQVRTLVQAPHLAPRLAPQLMEKPNAPAGIGAPFSSPGPVAATGAASALPSITQAQVRLAQARALFEAILAGWNWLAAKRSSQVASKRLRVLETVSLGEKRFAAVLRVDGAQFLVGGGANNVSLLASLEGSAPHARFAQVFEQQAAGEPGL